jgi:predicted RNase H-like nuclease (RuvC/YqgF family)
MSKDPTKDLPGDEEESPPTRIMLETILARLNDQGVKLDVLNAKVDDLSAKFDNLSARVERLEARVDGVGAKLEEGFDNIGHQLMVISGDIIRLRADAIRQVKRVDDLEKKAS